VKIALIDNMNNNFFAMARYLRDLGVDAYVYVVEDSNMSHFSAEADTFRDIAKLDYIKTFPCGVTNKSWLFFNKNYIKKEFADYDLIITCGLSSAYLERAGIHTDIAIPYGTDLYEVPFRKIVFEFSMNSIRSLLWISQAKYQKMAYENSRFIVTDDGYELYATALGKLGLKAINMGIPMLYNKENIENKENVNIWSFLDEYDFIVFNHSRQYWVNNDEKLDDYDKYGGLKRNDKLIYAFAEFIKITKYKKPVLVLFEYGPDVGETKKMISSLGLESYVRWMPTMERKHIMLGLERATFSSNAFRENKTDIGGVCYESLSAGTPHITNCIEATTNPLHKFYMAPMIHAICEKDILNVFLTYEANPSVYKNIGAESKKWFDENLGMGLAKKYKQLIEILGANKLLTQNDQVIQKIIADKDLL
jgi:hypothetical protein